MLLAGRRRGKDGLGVTITFSASRPFQWRFGYAYGHTTDNGGMTQLRAWWLWFAVAFYSRADDDVLMLPWGWKR